MLVDGFDLFICSHQLERAVGTQRDGGCAICANGCRWKVFRLQWRNNLVPITSTLLDEVCEAKRFAETWIASCGSRVNKTLGIDQRGSRISHFDTVAEDLNSQVLVTLFQVLVHECKGSSP